jgi:hypothetical protein
MHVQGVCIFLNFKVGIKMVLWEIPCQISCQGYQTIFYQNIFNFKSKFWVLLRLPPGFYQIPNLNSRFLILWIENQMRKILQKSLHINIVYVWKEWIHNHLHSKARSLKNVKLIHNNFKTLQSRSWKLKCFVKQTSMFLKLWSDLKLNLCNLLKNGYFS